MYVRNSNNSSSLIRFIGNNSKRFCHDTATIKLQVYCCGEYHRWMNTQTMQPDSIVYVYWIDTVDVQNNLPTEFSKRTIFII